MATADGEGVVDIAVAVADGAMTISDVAVLADQAVLFGRWRRARRVGGCWIDPTPRGWARSPGLE